MKKILVFAGSNSSQSINQKLAVYAAGFLADTAAKVIELRNFQAPIFSQDLEKEEGIPETIIKFSEIINRADGYIIGLPEYNSSMTAIFKNTVDWISRHDWPMFKDKPVLLTATSGGKRGAKTNLGHLAEVMPYWGAKVTGTFSLPGYYDNTRQEPNFKIMNREKNVELLRTVMEFERAL